MDKKTIEFLNGLPDLEARLGDSLECEMPYFDHTGDSLEDTGRNPEGMARDF